jgi:septal ring factor EnvC (AmiA/AmiB activator)
MSEGDPSALTTACDDLQAQLEAGDRSMRHLDYDVSQLQWILHTAMMHAEKIGNLQRHMRELRANMREQRQALREVRRAAHLLCGAAESAREAIATLTAEQRAADANDAALLPEDEASRTRERTSPATSLTPTTASIPATTFEQATSASRSSPTSADPAASRRR